jgi:predicted nuclease of predicted toxin-antitoxin system
MQAAVRLAQRSRFLVDECLGVDVTGVLKNWGCNVQDSSEAGLRGKDDTTVFQYAWKSGRILLTHDRDYLDDQEFPEHRNPGVVILPGAEGDNAVLIRALRLCVDVMGKMPDIWRGAKVVIVASGEITVRQREHDSGRVTSTKYRMEAGVPQEWIDEN